MDDNHAAVRVGAATTNLQMLSWSTKNGWTLPMDIIALMITYGGSNATITHGAGINNKNLNDIVLKIEFVNALGELQVIFHSYLNYVDNKSNSGYSLKNDIEII